VSAPNVISPAPPAAPAQPARYGEVYDRGYQHYDGPRLGRLHAQWALVRYSMKRALGIKKGVGAKIMPILLYVAVLMPVIVSLGIRSFVPTADVLDYADFFGFIFVIEGIFVATIAPEMLCGDRRENVLALYFSRAITRADYLLAKLLATAILVLTVSLIPAAILWLGRQLILDDPLQAMGDNIDDLGRILLAGTLIAFFLGAVGLVVSAFTGRKSIAVAIIVIGFVVFESLAGALRFGIDDDWGKYVLFLSPSSTIAGLVGRLFDEPGLGVEADLWQIIAVMGGVILVAGGIMYLRYVPDE